MILVLLPAYNEAPNLPSLLRKIKETMIAHAMEYRVLLVNDGSVDETLAVGLAHAEHMPLEIVHHHINRGLWETIRDGFEWAALHSNPGDIIVRMDADDTHEPQYIPDLVAKLNEGFDVVITSRFQPGGGSSGVGAYRSFISQSANLLLKMIFPIPGVWEYSCGYRSYRAEVVQAALSIFGNQFIDVRGLGFTCTLEKLLKFRMMGVRIGEVPFQLRYDQKQGKSKMTLGLTTLGYLVLILKYTLLWGETGRHWMREIKRWRAGRKPDGVRSRPVGISAGMPDGRS